MTTRPQPQPAIEPTTCPHCGAGFVRWGKDRDGHQRYKCKGASCRKTFAVRPRRPLGTMRLPVEKATTVVSLLVEGMSIRAAERVTGVHRDTICRLLRVVGGKCESLLARIVRDVEVKDVQADEIWGFVGMKAKTKRFKSLSDPEIGDAWTYVAIERESKLILAHHLGHRTALDTSFFIGKLDRATKGEFQLSTDGLDSYADPIVHQLGTRVQYGQVVKHYGKGSSEDQRRYSPATIIASEKRAIHGKPDRKQICTSHIERQNLNLRMRMRRLTRLTNGFSKKWANLRAAVALEMAHHNFCRIHGAIRCTPAMAANLCKGIWSVGDLVAA